MEKLFGVFFFFMLIHPFFMVIWFFYFLCGIYEKYFQMNIWTLPLLYILHHTILFIYVNCHNLNWHFLLSTSSLNRIFHFERFNLSNNQKNTLNKKAGRVLRAINTFRISNLLLTLFNYQHDFDWEWESKSHHEI